VILKPSTSQNHYLIPAVGFPSARVVATQLPSAEALSSASLSGTTVVASAHQRRAGRRYALRGSAIHCCIFFRRGCHCA